MKPNTRKEHHQLKSNNKRRVQNKESNENKSKELLSLQKQLVKKIYIDLFQSNPSFYQEKHLSYENFIYYFYNDIISVFDYKRETHSYDQLLLEVESLILKKFPSSNVISSMTPLQKQHLALIQKQQDDWTIISKYQTQLYQDEEKRQLEKIAQSLKDYYQSITDQIENKKNYAKEQERKRQLELQEKYNKERETLSKTQQSIKQNIVQLMKNEEYISLDNKNRLKSKLTREAIVNQSLHHLLEQNDNITNESKDMIQYKLGLIAIEQKKALVNSSGFNTSESEISKLVDSIMKQKEDQKLFKTIKKSSDDMPKHKIQSNIIPDMEEKVNQIIKTKFNANITKD